MENHAERAHATWSASSTERNWNCSGALALSRQVEGLEVESEAAAWGTAAHQVAEFCLTEGFEAAEMIGRFIKTKEHTIEVDEEVAETAQVYVDYVRARQKELDGKLMIEQRFSLEKLKPPFDAGGTADAVIYSPSQKLLEVIDFKGGRGVVVSAKGNPQLRTYGLGAALANADLKIERVMTTIVQPRAGHPEGRIRSEKFHLSDLIEWTTDLVEVMNLSAEATEAYGKITGDITKEQWADKYLKAGEHCQFCPAAGFCPALQKKALDAVGVWFNDLSEPQLSNTPSDLSPEQIAKVLDAADMIEDYLKAVRALAHTLANSGTEIPNYVIVEKQGRRKWRIEDEKELAGQLFVTADLSPDDIYNEPKLKSPAQIEKVLGAKNKKLIAELIETPVTGTNLVRADKTTRKAVAPAVLTHFDVIE